MKYPSAIDPTIHQLPSAGINRWLTDNNKAHLLFLVMLPIGIALLSMVSGPEILPISLMTIPVALIVSALLLSGVKERLKHSKTVTRLNEGLVLEAPFFNQKLLWADIYELIDTSDDEYLMDTRYGAFYLAKSLSGCDTLCSEIKSKIPQPAMSYDFSSHTDFDSIMRVSSAAVLIIVSLVFHILSPLAMRGQLTVSSTELVICLILVILTSFVWWVFIAKVPRLFRINKDGIHIRTHSRPFNLSWHQIERYKKIGPRAILIGSESSWFLIVHSMMSRKEETKSRLLECKSNLPKLTDKS